MSEEKNKGAHLKRLELEREIKYISGVIAKKISEAICNSLSVGDTEYFVSDEFKKVAKFHNWMIDITTTDWFTPEDHAETLMDYKMNKNLVIGDRVINLERFALSIPNDQNLELFV